MSRKNKRNQQSEQQAMSSVAPVVREFITLSCDRNMLQDQDDTISDMYDDGYIHYETFDINSGTVGLRFMRKHKGEIDDR